MQCRLCGNSTLLSVLDLGATPPCERFLTATQLDEPEVTYPLHMRLCPECLLLQIPALITPEDTFTDYAYYSSFSDSWVAHAKTFVDDAVGRLDLGPDSFVVEVASNDGYLLQHVVAAGIRCLGFEPSSNVGAAARDRGVPTVTEFLAPSSARRIRDEHGPADLVVANNVYAHIPDLLGFTEGLRILLADDGHLSIEVHHALHLVASAQFDTVYHEHFQYFTVLAARRALVTAGLDLYDVEMLPTHGGSIRLWASPAEAGREPGPSVQRVLDLEADAGLHRTEGYRLLQPAADEARRRLLEFLLEQRRSGARTVAYGAPGKGNTLLNYSGIRTDLIEYAVDRNPYKHGRYTPGTRIPIHPPERIAEDRPDIVVVLPWNLRTELVEQLRYVGDWGGRLVFPLPTLEIVEPARSAVAGLNDTPFLDGAKR